MRPAGRVAELTYIGSLGAFTHMSKRFVLASATVAIVIVAVGIGVPRYIGTQAKPSVSSCVNNLRWIDGLKEQWALEHAQTVNAPTRDDLRPYMQGRTNFPICPGGGTYTIGQRGEIPTCSYPGHITP